MASLLAVVMVMTMLPAAAMAAEEPAVPDEAQDAAAEEREDLAEVPPEESEGLPAASVEPEESIDPVEVPQETSWSTDGSEVVYNTGSMAVTVGSSPAVPERMYYDAFQPDGSYTIEVCEPDPFFPYEVQFTCGGETWSEWFEEPEDTVSVGGHTFRLACSGMPTYLGFQVSGYYVPAYPEAKQFTTAQNYGSSDYDPEAGIAPASLLPLETKYVSADFSGFLPEELTEVGVRAFLSGQTMDGGNTVLWIDMGTDTCQIEGTVDLSPYVSETGSGDYPRTAQIIAGTVDQLNPDNTRYIVSFSTSQLGDLLEMQAYTNRRTRIGAEHSVSSQPVRQENGMWRNETFFNINAYSDPIWELRDALVCLRFYTQSTALKKLEEKGELSAQVYSGRLEDVSAATPITDQIWDQSDLTASGGHVMDGMAEGNDWLTIALEHNGKTHLLQRSLQFSYYSVHEFLDFGFQALREDGSLWQTQKDFWPYTPEDDDALHYDVRISSEEWKDGETALVMTCDEQVFAGEGLSAAVYEGHYGSEATALLRGAEDIADEFFGVDAAGYRKDYSEGVPFTLVLKVDGEPVETVHLVITVAANLERVYVYPANYLYTADRRNPATGMYQRSESGTYFYTMRYVNSSSPENYARDGKYCLSMSASTTYLHEAEGYVDGIVDIKGAYLGRFAAAGETEGQTDLKAELFGDGYVVDFANGAVTFTIVDVKDKLTYVTVNTLAALPELQNQRQSIDTYFRITGVNDTQGNPYAQYVVSSGDDSYYFNGFQTIFLLNQDGSPVTDNEIVPVFSTGTAVKPYVGHDEASGIIVHQGDKETFQHNTAVHYSAASESGTHLRNYWVTFLTQQPKAELFVSGMSDTDHYEDGMPTREVLLGAGSSNYHDIFVANVGAEKLTGLYVRLENAENIRLDDYWTISDKTAELAAFTSVSRTSAYGELDNVAKLRLYRTNGADGNPTIGEIKGTLVIGSTATGQEIKIKLKGTAGVPKITTDAVVDGVQYVPYSSVLQTNNMYRANGVSFALVRGTLPSGVILKQNGEIYGVPRVSGTFRFSVRATYNGQTSEVKDFQLYIAPNTDKNVYESSHESYELIPGKEIGERVENEVLGPYHYELDASELKVGGSHVFGSYGPYPYYIDFWLDGKKLRPGVDYTSEEGSTILTLSDATIEDNGNGTHTLAAEFREGDRENGTLKSTAQNYTIKGLPEPPAPTPPSGGNSGNSGNSGSSNGSESSASTPSTPATTPTTPTSPVTPTTPTTPDTGMPFTDVLPSHWFFGDVKWVYDNKYMEGVSATLFAPNQAITQATIVTVLARLAEIDLSQFDGISYPGIAGGNWYTQPAIWATQSGLLPDNSSFTGEEFLDRNGMAIMLVKYMRSLGLDTTPPQQRATFSDADQMTQESNDAFQILYQYNIFRGVGGTAMDPASSTTRAQFAALVQRISDFADTQK